MKIFINILLDLTTCGYNCSELSIVIDIYVYRELTSPSNSSVEKHAQPPRVVYYLIGSCRTATLDFYSIRLNLKSQWICALS